MKLIKENATVQKINARKITRGNIEHDKVYVIVTRNIYSIKSCERKFNYRQELFNIH